MKKIAILFLFWGNTTSFLFAQNPVVRTTTSRWDFGEQVYRMESESVSRYNELQQRIFSQYTFLPTGPFAALITEQSYYTYHPNGETASREKYSLRNDSLRNYHLSRRDERGNLIYDSTYYKWDPLTEDMYVSRFTYNYDEQDRLSDLLQEQWSLDNPHWTSVRSESYLYDPNGCLSIHYSGYDPQVPPSERIVYTHDNHCRLEAVNHQRLENGVWTGHYRAHYDYEDYPDSTAMVVRNEYYQADSSRWENDGSFYQVLDTRDRVVRSLSLYPSGFATASIRRFSGDTYEADYSRESFRVTHSSQWVISFEFSQLEKNAGRALSWMGIGWDTTRQNYRSRTLYDYHYDDRERLIEYHIVDSLWENNHYNVSSQRETYDYEDYCDGLAKVRYAKRGENGLAPQPTQKVEYGYLHLADCQADVSELDLLLMPNPATHLLTIQSEGLAHPQTRIRIIDQLGRELLAVDAPYRQTRMDISVRDLQAGTYVVQLSNDKQHISRTFLKQ